MITSSNASSSSKNVNPKFGSKQQKADSKVNDLSKR